MLATVELPEKLLKRAQRLAEERGISLGDLIGAALERDLSAGTEPFPAVRRQRFPLIPTRTPGHPTLTSEDIERVEDDFPGVEMERLRIS